ncbi:MAG: menaquinone biosynthesis family protein [Chloroflexota bacterium]
MTTAAKTLTIGHSPDADDAFMFYALAHEIVTVPGYEIQHVMDDIESLNKRAARGELDVTAISAAQYPTVSDQYRIMSCGASIGRNYGPVIVARQPISPSDLSGKRVGVPGEFTTSYLLFRIFVEAEAEPVFLNFDDVGPAVDDGRVDAGVLLHEGQILYERQGYHKVMDLGVEWWEATGLPIPLGLDCVHRRFGEEDSRMIAGALHRAIVHALQNEDAALDYALQYGRGIDREDGRRFVRMYVNQDTVDMGEEGRAALERLFGMAAQRGIIPARPPLDLIPVA